jgi:GNAT superfamily N-acetyltransferase
VVRSSAASDVYKRQIIGLVDEGDRLIGIVRVMTDFVYRAMVFDVIVNPTHRKMGLGTKLMDALVNHPKLQAVEKSYLNCLPKMIPFYERWGFTDDMGEIKFMGRKKP